MRQLSERRRKWAVAAILLGAMANFLPHVIHGHRAGTVGVGLVVALQLWAFVLLVKPEHKED